MAVVVKPEAFDQVEYDATQVAAVAVSSAESACASALDGDIVVEIDQSAPTSRAEVVSLDPVEFHIESGALERYARPRTLGELESGLTFARLFLEVCDRRSTSFGAPDLRAELSHAHRIAWDTNLFGRASRLGFVAHKPRHRYDFRNRHGFNGPADRIFAQLWASDDLTWSDIVALSDTAVAPVVASRPRVMDDIA